MCFVRTASITTTSGMQWGGLSYLLSSHVFSYLDDWLIKTSVTAEHKKTDTVLFFFFLRLEFIALCCNRASQILSQAL